MKKQKSLLNEATIRRFMKLAGTQPLSEAFVSDREEEEEELGGEEDYEAEEEELPPDVDDMGLEEPEAEEAGPAGDVDVEALVTAIADAIEAETGVEVSVEGEAEGLPGEEEVLPGEEEALPGEEAPPEGLGGPPEEGPLEMGAEEEEEEEFPVMEEQLVNEVAKRVAARLLHEMRKKQKRK